MTKLECHICHNLYRDNSSLARHLKYVHEIGLTKVKCHLCNKELKTQYQLEKHLQNVHEIGLVLLECNLCDKKFKTKYGLTTHLSNVHDVSCSVHKCPEKKCELTFQSEKHLNEHISTFHPLLHTCQICNKIFASRHNLGYHIRVQHNESKISCTECNQEFKRKRALKEHLARIHEIGTDEFEWRYCDINDCQLRFINKCDIDRHKKLAHKIGVEYRKCPEDGCDSQFYDLANLNYHLKRVHGIGLVKPKCTKCGATFKTKYSLDEHLATQHNVGTEKFTWYYCKIDNCNYKTVRKRHLKRHQSSLHDIDVIYHYCKEKDCESKFKQKTGLVQHLSQVHDIGKNQCEFCLGHHNSKILYKDKIKNQMYKICRKCFNKLTGKNSRAEEVMSKYLDEIPNLKHFLVGTDKSLSSMGGCQRYRPDKIFMSSDLVLHIGFILQITLLLQRIFHPNLSTKRLLKDLRISIM